MKPVHCLIARIALVVMLVPSGALAQASIADVPPWQVLAQQGSKTQKSAPRRDVPQLPSRAEPAGRLSLSRALQRALAANPRLTAAERQIGISVGQRIQAGAFPNPEVGLEVDNAWGSGPYRGFQSAEMTLQLSQLIELYGKRAARVAAATAELESAQWERAALRLEIASETAAAFYSALVEQLRVQMYDAQIADLDRLGPLLQRRVDAGASSPAEIARAQVASDIVRADRERARTSLAIARRELAVLMGAAVPDFSTVVGDLNRVGQPPAFQLIVRSLDSNPQLIRWTAVRAQRDAEILSARLKPVPDVRFDVGWRRFRETNDNAVRLGLSIPIPAWDQNIGGIRIAEEARDKVDAEFASSKAALILTLGKAYETLTGALREIEILRASALPNAERALETVEAGYGQGRFTLLEVLDVHRARAEAALREVEALLNFHNAVATLEGLTGSPLTLTRGARR